MAWARSLKTRILHHFDEQPDAVLSVTQICEKFGVTPETVRNKLRPLVHAGVLIRVLRAHHNYYSRGQGVPVEKLPRPRMVVQEEGTLGDGGVLLASIWR